MSYSVLNTLHTVRGQRPQRTFHSERKGLCEALSLGLPPSSHKDTRILSQGLP